VLFSYAVTVERKVLEDNDERAKELECSGEYPDTTAIDRGHRPCVWRAGPGFNGGLAEAVEEISHTAESIHQEPVFKASRKRVYEALTDAKQFNKVVLLSTAMKSAWHRKQAHGDQPRSRWSVFAFRRLCDGTAHRTCTK